jgi:type I restriction enzyme, S subunit
MISPTFRRFLEAVKSATTSVAAIYQRSLYSAPFPLPSVTVQQEIVRRIETAFAWLDRIAAEHANASRLLPKLDQAILAKAFRGELVRRPLLAWQTRRSRQIDAAD